MKYQIWFGLPARLNAQQQRSEHLPEIHISGKRFEVELQLHDATGKTIGAVSEVFACKPGDDKRQFRKRAEAIRVEIEKKIPSVAKLVEPDLSDTARR